MLLPSTYDAATILYADDRTILDEDELRLQTTLQKLEACCTPTHLRHPPAAFSRLAVYPPRVRPEGGTLPWPGTLSSLRGTTRLLRDTLHTQHRSSVRVAGAAVQQ
jgi:hypothetical protein